METLVGLGPTTTVILAATGAPATQDAGSPLATAMACPAGGLATFRRRRGPVDTPTVGLPTVVGLALRIRPSADVLPVPRLRDGRLDVVPRLGRGNVLAVTVEMDDAVRVPSQANVARLPTRRLAPAMVARLPKRLLAEIQEVRRRLPASVVRLTAAVAACRPSIGPVLRGLDYFPRILMLPTKIAHVPANPENTRRGPV